MKEKFQFLAGGMILSKAAQKHITGGVFAGGSCGNVITTTAGDRCVVGGIPKAQAINNSAQYNLGQGEYSEGGYGSVTDVNWCCASCSNFDECGDLIDA